jgi:hypothetical protein
LRGNGYPNLPSAPRVSHSTRLRSGGFADSVHVVRPIEFRGRRLAFMLGCTAQYLLFLPLIVLVSTRGAEPIGAVEAAVVFVGMALFLIVPGGLWIGRHRVVLDDDGIHTLRGTKTTRFVAWTDIERCSWYYESFWRRTLKGSQVLITRKPATPFSVSRPVGIGSVWFVTKSARQTAAEALRIRCETHGVIYCS